VLVAADLLRYDTFGVRRRAGKVDMIEQHSYRLAGCEEKFVAISMGETSLRAAQVRNGVVIGCSVFGANR